MIPEFSPKDLEALKTIDKDDEIFFRPSVVDAKASKQNKDDAPDSKQTKTLAK